MPVIVVLSTPERRVDLLTDALSTCGFQIPHCGFEVFVSKPQLHGAKINPGLQMLRCERRTELVQPKIILIQSGTFSNCLSEFQKLRSVLAWSAVTCGEHKFRAVVLFLPLLQ